MKIVDTIPIVRSFDEAKAREFYCNYLGFDVNFEHRFEPELPLFLGLKMGAARLYVTEHHGDAAPGTHVIFQVEGLRDYHVQLRDKKYGFARPGLSPHIAGGIQLEVADPFGNRIEFFEPNG